MAKQTSNQQAGKRVIVNDGRNQRIWVFPPEGLEMRLQIHGNKVVASFEEGAGLPGNGFQITDLLSSLTVEPIVNPQFPFRPYQPGQVAV